MQEGFGINDVEHHLMTRLIATMGEDHIVLSSGIESDGSQGTGRHDKDIPARLTAFLMVLPRLVTINTHGGSKLFTFHFSLLTFVRKYGRNHASPNSGYPEATLAAILNCRFGGPHYYFGELFDKPYIGTNDRALTTEDMKTAVRVNRTAEVLMVLLTAVIRSIW